MTPEQQILFDYLQANGCKDEGEVMDLLSDCFDQFEGSDFGSMKNRKLSRIEDLSWDKPILQFRIERHGTIVLGSTRGEMHTWYYNFEDSTAEMTESGFRQLEKRSPNFDAKLKAREIVEIIKKGKKEDYLEWETDNIVVVTLSKVIPRSSGFKRTVEDRLKRLGEELLIVALLKEFDHIPKGNRKKYRFEIKKEHPN